MFKHIKTLIIGLVIFCVIFTFMPTGSSGNQVVSGFKQMSAGATAQQSGGLVSAYNVVWDEKPPEVQPGEAMYTGQQGLASGLWGTTSELRERVDRTDHSSGFSAAELSKALDHVGEPPIAYTNGKAVSFENNPAGAHDPWLGEDGIGIIRYTQGYSASSGMREPWAGDTYHGGVTFSGSSCGLIATANAISTLTRRWVNPMELFVVIGTSDTYGKTLNPCPNGMGTGAFSYTALAWACREAGLQCSEGGFTLDKLDDCLDAGGVCVKSLSGPPYNAGGGHYIMIYGKVECSHTTRGHCYLICNATYRGGDAANYGFPYTDKSGKTWTYTENHIVGHHTGSRIAVSEKGLFIYPNPDLIPDGTDLSAGLTDGSVDTDEAN